MSRNPRKPYDLVPVDEARARILTLRDAGASYHDLAIATGISANVLNSVARGRRKRISRENHGLIMRCHPPARPAPGRVVDATGTRRRLRALAADGWSATAIAERTGVNLGQLHEVRSGSLTRVKAMTATRVAQFYDKASPSDAPDGCGKERALATARRNDWARPAAWDDADLDNPDAPEPEPAHVDTATVADLDEFDFLTRIGTSPEEAARRLRTTLSALARRARRHGRLDIAARADAARAIARSAA